MLPAGSEGDLDVLEAEKQLEHGRIPIQHLKIKEIGLLGLSVRLIRVTRVIRVILNDYSEGLLG